jgi:hypothetical protein
MHRRKCDRVVARDSLIFEANSLGSASDRGAEHVPQRKRMTRLRFLVIMTFLFSAATMGTPVAGQTVNAATDPSARLRQVLPPDVAAHVLAVIADARVHGLPANALEQRALKFAARGVPPADIARAVDEHAARQARARALLESVRGSRITGDEVEAGAEAIREGVDEHGVSTLARSSPSGRSLTIPLYVLGNLRARGVPTDQALARLHDRLAAGASDTDLETLPSQAEDAHGRGPGAGGRDVGATRKPSAAPGASGGQGQGPPAGVPANGGKKTHPKKPHGRPGKP